MSPRVKGLEGPGRPIRSSLALSSVDDTDVDGGCCLATSGAVKRSEFPDDAKLLLSKLRSKVAVISH